MNRPDDSRPGILLSSIIATLVIAAALLVYPGRKWRHDEDVMLYHRYTSRAFEGLVPDRDYTMEYPIAGFAIMLPPRLLRADFRGYFLAFVAEVLVFNAVGMYLVGRTIDRQFCRKEAIRRIAWYTLFGSSGSSARGS